MCVYLGSPIPEPRDPTGGSSWQCQYLGIPEDCIPGDFPGGFAAPWAGGADSWWTIQYFIVENKTFRISDIIHQ